MLQLAMTYETITPESAEGSALPGSTWGALIMKNNPPVRLRIKCADGTHRTYYTGYAAIAKYRAQGRLICAWSTSTGKAIA